MTRRLLDDTHGLERESSGSPAHPDAVSVAGLLAIFMLLPAFLEIPDRIKTGFNGARRVILRAPALGNVYLSHFELVHDLFHSRRGTVQIL
jgi:hypothetical protein